ncbi:MAG: undecaprenyl-diphosphate phosphatase, partial [Synergistaceae bacterium]|nr:undecaprenyl-diphosphate phosphatase [Synergistaceae bacterium]
LITGIIGILLKDTAERISQSITLVGAGEILTGILLLMMPIMARPRNFNLLTLSIIVGIAQGIAVLPGISRSGMSIFACMIMGMGISEAFRYSFLISIPAILGATMLELLKAYKGTEAIYLPEYGITGCIFAFILGLLSLMIMRRIVKVKNWSYFGIYCIIIGVIAEVLVSVTPSF